MSQRVRPVNLRARVYTIVALLGFSTAALVVRAVDLQVVSKDFYRGEGDARYLRDIPIPVSRGSILDRNGEPLAVSTPVDAIWANPKELLEHRDRLPELASALGVDVEALTQRVVQRADKGFIYLKRPVDPDSAEALLALRIPGVASERAFRRYYPSGEVMAHILGTTNIDDRGQEGLELAFDNWLVGTPGVKRVVRDLRGQVVENVELVREAQPGRDLTLSIDRRIQYLAYRELMAAITRHNAQSGSMVVLDVTNGEILAMVNQPSFNPNVRGSADPSTRRNRAVTDVVEPGSTMKAFTVAAGLASGKWTPTTPVDMSAGSMLVAGNVVRDIHNYGYGDVTKVITKSSNIGSAKIALSVSNEHFYNVLRGVGFGEITGSGFPGESPGFLPVGKSWGAFQKATLSFGYALNVTPLQLAQAYAVFANHGRLRPPTFVKDNPNPDKEILDPLVADQMVSMMETVISPQGSGLRAAVPNYRVAGKTGTSRRFTKGGYENRYISLFAGIVPASNPRLVGVVVIHDPGSGKGGVYYGGLVAAPVFSTVMDGALRLLNVSPDNVQHWYAGSPESGAPINRASVAPDYAEGETSYEEGVPQ